MKTKRLIIIILLLPTISLGQHLNDSLLATFYNKTLVYYFSDSTTSNDQRLFQCILIKTEFDTSRLTKVIGKKILFYFNDNTPEYTLLYKPFKENKGRSIYWINHKLFSKDTVDINIGGWTIEKASRRKLNLEAWCGGTMGYIPDGRLIFDKPTGHWKFMSADEIIGQKIIEDKSKMNKE